MAASKEDCQHALDNLNTQEAYMNEYAFHKIRDFLEACLTRLPSQAAINRDAAKKRVKKKTAGKEK